MTRGFAMSYWRDSTGQRAIGRRVRSFATAAWYTIVGVAGDVRDTSLTAPATSVVYFPADVGHDSTDAWPRGMREMAFVVRARDSPAELRSEIERAIHTVSPTVPIYDIASMQERVATAASRVTFVLTLLAAGAAVTLLLGVVGLYGVIAYVVGLRSREIGIRIALGMSPERATRMILAHGEAIVLAGVGVGLCAFLAFARLLGSLTFQVSVIDDVAIATSCAIILLVASVATWLPARHASHIDPAEALRAD